LGGTDKIGLLNFNLPFFFFTSSIFKPYLARPVPLFKYGFLGLMVLHSISFSNCLFSAIFVLHSTDFALEKLSTFLLGDKITNSSLEFEA